MNQVFAANSDNQLLRILVLVPGRSEIEQMTGRVMASEEEDELAKQFSGQGLGLGQLQGPESDQTMGNHMFFWVKIQIYVKFGLS